MSVYLVLLGAPGAGKGTQAKRLMKALNVPHISSGNIFRENLNKPTELGKLAQTFISDGQLVPDDVTIAMIRARLKQDDCAMGAVLDGFPRTPTQAEALDVILADLGSELDAVLYIKVAQEILVRRLSGRWMCRAAGHVFHDEFNPPLVPGVCDHDGSELYQRNDDRAETVAKRIRVYIKQTAPLIDYYRQRGLLVAVDGDQSIEAVTDSLMAVLPEGAVQ